MKKMQKVIATALLSLSLCAVPVAAMAKTVYYKGTAVYWNYGRNAYVYAFSDCNSQVYEHSSSTNGYSSGWQDKGVMAKAWGFIGNATQEAYWNCRG